MDYQKLRNEIINDPLSRGYSGMSDNQVADSLNTKDRQRNKTIMTGTEVLQNIVDSEYNALTDAKKSQFWGLLGISSLNPFGKETTVVVNIFGQSSQTISNLQTARVESISRGEELGIGVVGANDVSIARGGIW